MSNLRTNIRPGRDLLSPLVCCQHHSDGDVTVGVAVGLNAGPLDPLHPGIQVILRLSNVAAIRGIASGVGLAQGHGALGEGSVDSVFSSSAETNPRVSEAGGDPIFDHPF